MMISMFFGALDYTLNNGESSADPVCKTLHCLFSHACYSGVRTVCESLILHCAMLVHIHRFTMVLMALCTLLLLGVKRVGRDTTFTPYRLNPFTAMVSLENNQ